MVVGQYHTLRAVAPPERAILSVNGRSATVDGKNCMLTPETTCAAAPQSTLYAVVLGFVTSAAFPALWEHSAASKRAGRPLRDGLDKIPVFGVLSTCEP